MATLFSELNGVTAKFKLPIKRFTWLTMVALGLSIWQPSLADSAAPKAERTKQADDLVPVANEHNEQQAKEALRYLQHSHTIPLSVNPSCATIGMEFSDKTIGDFTNGMLSQFVYAKGTNSKNWITGVCRDAKNTSKKKLIRDCEINFHQARLDEEVLWAWGFKFSAEKRSGSIIRSTLVCVTAG